MPVTTYPIPKPPIPARLSAIPAPHYPLAELIANLVLICQQINKSKAKPSRAKHSGSKPQTKPPPPSKSKFHLIVFIFFLWRFNV